MTNSETYKFQREINYSKVWAKYTQIDNQHVYNNGVFTFSDANNEISVDATELRDFINTINFKNIIADNRR